MVGDGNNADGEMVIETRFSAMGTAWVQHTLKQAADFLCSEDEDEADPVLLKGTHCSGGRM